MTKRMCYITGSAAIASLIAFAPYAFAGTAGSVTAAQEAKKTLKSMEGLAYTASDNAAQLKNFSQDERVDSTAHQEVLSSLKAEINQMGKEISALEAQRATLEPWEKQAVDKVLPLLKEAAANAESATEYYNENRERLWNPEYRGYADKISRDSHDIAKTLNSYLKYEKVHHEEQQLQSTIGVGAN